MIYMPTTERSTERSADPASFGACSTLPQEILLDGKSLTETEVFEYLHERYIYNLKENFLSLRLISFHDRFSRMERHPNSSASYTKNHSAFFPKTKWGELCILILKKDEVPRQATQRYFLQPCFFIISRSNAKCFFKILDQIDNPSCIFFEIQRSKNTDSCRKFWISSTACFLARPCAAIQTQ